MADRVLKERYAIQKQLSKNAGRRTFIARDLHTQDLVVIKLLVFGADFQWDTLKLFEREAQALQMLSHPAIPRYLDYFDVDTAMGKGLGAGQIRRTDVRLTDLDIDDIKPSEQELRETVNDTETTARIERASGRNC